MTEAELLDALRDALAPSVEEPEGARTTDELMEDTGFGEKKIRRSLQILKKKGELEAVRVFRESIDGRRVPVPAFRRKAA